MTTSDAKCPIDENSVLWIDGADTDGPWNYIVKQRAPWKNSTSYAIKQVTIVAYQETQKQIAEALALKAKYAQEPLVIEDAEDKV